MIGPHSITLSIDEAKMLIKALETLGIKAMLKEVEVFGLYREIKDAIAVAENFATYDDVNVGDERIR